MAAFELMVMTRAIGNLIREGKTQQILNALQAGKQDGHVLLNESLQSLIDAGLIEVEEARRRAYDAGNLKAKK